MPRRPARDEVEWDNEDEISHTCIGFHFVVLLSLVHLIHAFRIFWNRHKLKLTSTNFFSFVCLSSSLQSLHLSG